jgi:transcriptional regulator GlxA family with amidase domain
MEPVTAELAEEDSMATERSSELQVGIYLFEGVEELDFAGPWEVLGAWSRMETGPAEVTTVAESTEPLRCAHGLTVTPDRSWADAPAYDLLVLPGGRVGNVSNPAVYERLRALADGGTLMASVCNGAVVYAEAGLLDGKPATTHWGSVERLEQIGKESGREIEVRADARYVDAGQVLTAAGVSAGIDLALYLIKRLDSEEAARDVRRYIQYDPAPPV